MMQKQCPNGHMYDPKKYSSCPYCSGATADKTVPLDGAYADEFPHTIPLDDAPKIINMENETIPEPIIPTAPVNDYGKTVYLGGVSNDIGVREAVGWLVCISSPRCGVDFTLRSEKNTIGRGQENDVVLDFDDTISKTTNAIITYDVKNNKTYLYQGQSRSKNNVYVNDELLLMPVELKDFDVIELGHTRLVYRSLCCDKFSWKQLSELNGAE